MALAEGTPISRAFSQSTEPEVAIRDDSFAGACHGRPFSRPRRFGSIQRRTRRGILPLLRHHHSVATLDDQGDSTRYLDLEILPGKFHTCRAFSFWHFPTDSLAGRRATLAIGQHGSNQPRLAAGPPRNT